MEWLSSQSSAEPVITAYHRLESRASCQSSENALERPSPLSSFRARVERTCWLGSKLNVCLVTSLLVQAPHSQVRLTSPTSYCISEKDWSIQGSGLYIKLVCSKQLPRALWGPKASWGCGFDLATVRTSIWKHIQQQLLYAEHRASSGDLGCAFHLLHLKVDRGWKEIKVNWVHPVC